MSADFLPHHALVAAEGAKPARWMLVLHGILGSGGNFRSFARRLATALPAWGFALVDLRMHGLSQGAPPPHGVAAAAADLARLEAHLGLSIAGVIGHSFGGKVALAYADSRPHDLAELWVLDASPGPRRDRRGTTESVVAMLRSLPDPLPSRERFLELVQERGFSRDIADWLAMNVRRDGDAFRFRLDLGAIEALVDDYFALDLWPALDRPLARAMHVVVAGRSDAFDAADRARLTAIAAKNPALHAHLIEGAGHWVHVDAPDALFSLITREIS